MVSGACTATTSPRTVMLSSQNSTLLTTLPDYAQRHITSFQLTNIYIQGEVRDSFKRGPKCDFSFQSGEGRAQNNNDQVTLFQLLTSQLNSLCDDSCEGMLDRRIMAKKFVNR